MTDLDVVRGPIPAGTVFVLADGRVVRLATSLPGAPDGLRRCWWCCPGRLIPDDDEVEASHRFAAWPSAADAARCRRERAERAEAAEREKCAVSSGASLTGDVWHASF